MASNFQAEEITFSWRFRGVLFLVFVCRRRIGLCQYIVTNALITYHMKMTAFCDTESCSLAAIHHIVIVGSNFEGSGSEMYSSIFSSTLRGSGSFTRFWNVFDTAFLYSEVSPSVKGSLAWWLYYFISSAHAPFQEFMSVLLHFGYVSLQ